MHNILGWDACDPCELLTELLIELLFDLLSEMLVEMLSELLGCPRSRSNCYPNS